MKKKLIFSLLVLAGVPSLSMAVDEARLLRFPVEHDAVCQRVQPEPAAEIGRQLDGFAVHRRKIGPVVQSVLANFKGQVRPVAGPAAMPGLHLPRQRLIDRDAAAGLFSQKCVDAHRKSRPVPVIVIAVFAQFAVIRLHIAAQIWIVRARGVHHDAARDERCAAAAAVVSREDVFMQLHAFASLRASLCRSPARGS